MSNESLQEQVSRIHPGDEVEVVFQMYGTERPPVSGEVWEGDEGALYIGNSALGYYGGRPATALVRIVSHTPKRCPIKRGDVVQSPKDAARWDVPWKAAFRLADGIVIVVFSTWPEDWPDHFFPARCVDLLSDWEDES